MDFLRKRWISGISAILVMLLAISVMTGWTFDIPNLRTLLPGMPAMAPLTATMVILLAVSLFLMWIAYTRQLTSRALRNTVCILLLIPLGVGIFNLLGFIFSFETGLNYLLFFDKVVNEKSLSFSGKLSVQTSTSTIFLAMSMLILLFDLSKFRRAFWFFQISLLLTMFICLIALVGYLNDITATGSSRLIGLSLPAAISFLLLAVGTLFFQIERGIVQKLSARDSGGLFLRWYVTFSVFFPILSSVLINSGGEAGLYPEAFGNTISVILTIISLLALGAFMSVGIRNLELQRLAIQRSKADAALRESEESLKETKEHLEFALAASNMGTWENDLQKSFSKVNDTTARLLGYEPEEYQASLNAFLQVVHPDDLPVYLESRSAAIDQRADLNVELRCVMKNGAIRWVRVKGRAKYDRSGNPLRLTGTIVDITPEKRYQTELERALSEAESASRLKSSFLANMSHEIRTPLGAILGFTELLEDPNLSAQDRAHYLEVVQRNGYTLSHLINDILDLSKVESNHLDIETLRVSLRSIVEEVISLLEVRAREQKIYLNVEYIDSPPDAILTDPVRVKQVLMNLVGNALKFTNEGGVTLTVTANRDKLRFAIQDTGIGIDDSQKDKLFKPFTQADSSTTRIFGGTGLGLALSIRLAELLGGGIELVRSVPGQGSLFCFTIKLVSLQPLPEPAVRSSSEPAIQHLKGLRLLICEDSTDNQKLVQLMLQKEGAEMTMASNGQEGYEKAVTQDFDLILMDIQMPVMDGYEATQKLRGGGYKKPIVALTAHAMSDEHLRCLEAGCNDYLTKPIDRKKLIESILKYTGREA
ncbi:Aerobic respiration control sensor protein ArcB [compost metagenome]